MNKIILLVSLVCSTITVTGQNAALNCGNGRYINNVFTDFTKTAGVIYGYNTTTDYTNGNTYNHTLRFDFYEPAGDAATQRPLIILMFGGGFIAGQRSDMDSICIALTKKGYATATIDYRLVYPILENILAVSGSAAYLRDEVIKAAGDLKAAIRYFKRDAATINTYRIDPSKIIVGGASAGAIAALQAAYTDDINENPAATPQYNDNGGIEGNTDLPVPGNLLPAYNATGIAAIINIAGGIEDSSMVDANNPPIYSSQGTADEVIPYNYGTVKYNGVTTQTNLFGTHLIQTRANNIGLNNLLFPIPGGNHESPGFQPYIGQIIADASAFIQQIVCASTLPVTLTSFTVQPNNCTAVLRWKTAAEQQSSHYDIETSADGIRFIKIATVKSKNIAGGADYTYKLEGNKQAAWLRLKMADKDGGFTYSAIQKFNPACGVSVQVYPNPAKTQAFVAGLQTGMHVQVINAEGKLLWSQKATGNTLNIPLTTFANGLYLVQVMDGNGKVLVNNKLMKN